MAHTALIKVIYEVNFEDNGEDQLTDQAIDHANVVLRLPVDADVEVTHIDNKQL